VKKRGNIPYDIVLMGHLLIAKNSALIDVGLSQ